MKLYGHFGESWSEHVGKDLINQSCFNVSRQLSLIEIDFMICKREDYIRVRPGY
jgi:hypothetical protein